jgi:hypothetical protein
LVPISPKPKKVNYGLTTGFVSHNPFVLVAQGFIDLFKNKKLADTKKEAPAIILKKPAVKHEGYQRVAS